MPNPKLWFFAAVVAVIINACLGAWFLAYGHTVNKILAVVVNIPAALMCAVALWIVPRRWRQMEER